MPPDAPRALVRAVFERWEVSAEDAYLLAQRPERAPAGSSSLQNWREEILLARPHPGACAGGHAPRLVLADDPVRYQRKR